MVGPAAATSARLGEPLEEASAWLQNPYRQLFTVRSTAEANWRRDSDPLRRRHMDLQAPATCRPAAGSPATTTRAPRDVVEQQFTLQKLAGTLAARSGPPTAGELHGADRDRPDGRPRDRNAGEHSYRHRSRGCHATG